MIKVSETKRYNIKPDTVISDAFETAYTRYAEEQPVTPPDLAMPVSTAVSMLLLFVLFLLTSLEYAEERFIWLLLSALCLAITGRSFYKYFVQNKKYKQAAGKPSVVKAKREGFYAFFKSKDNELPETLSAGDMLKMVSPIIGKQNDQVYNNALREMSEDLARINNPSFTMCKLVNPCGDIFNQARRRLYFKNEGSQLVFFDTDWMNPKGEIVCDEDDVVSFGEYSKYPSSINKSGNKIRQDAVILEIKDGDNHVFFEFQSESYAEIKKAVSSRKERK